MKFKRAFAFIEAISAVETSREVGAAFTEAIVPHGYLAAACGGARDTPTGQAHEFFFNTWPAKWLSDYRQRDYVRHDPMPATARLTSSPFTFREIGRGRELTPKQLEIADWAEGLGVVDGLAVPVHEPGGDFGLCVSLADHIIEDTEERLALEFASLHAYRRCRILGGAAPATSSPSPLSSRELECLRWVLKGKSDREIGTLLAISPTTAHFHVERVKKKLGVRTRTQAAGRLVTLGYL
jgi:DNA-binding CsgD family transcriptional regulator